MRKGLFISTAMLLVLTLVGTALAETRDVNGSGWWSAVQVQRIGARTGPGTTVIPASVIMTGYDLHGDTGGPYDCGDRALADFGSAATFVPHWSTDPSGDNCANDANFPLHYEGASVVSADDAIVAIVQTQNMSFGGFAPGELTGGGRAVAAYPAVSAPSTEIKFPVYKNNHSNETTTFYIQNAGSMPTTVQAVFRPCADTGTGTSTSCMGYPNAYTYTLTGLAPSQMAVIDPAMAGVPAGNYAYGGLTINSTSDGMTVSGPPQPLAGVVFEHRTTGVPATYLKATRGFVTADYDDTYYAPAIKYQYPRGGSTTNPNLSKWSGLVIHNADSVQVTVNITYTVVARQGAVDHADVGSKFGQAPFTIEPGESHFLLYHTELSAPAGQIQDLLSAEIKATGNIVAIVNEEGDFRVGGARDLATYSVMPSSTAAPRVSVPTYKEQYRGKFHGAVAMNVGSSEATYTATLSVVDTAGGAVGVSVGDKVMVRRTATVPAGGSATFFMLCVDYFNEFTDLTGDDAQMADLCSGPANAPSAGANTGLIIESNQPIVVLANEELLWYEDPALRADGQGEDASNYQGFPLP